MVSPLNAFVPIVDPATGRPSPEFILFWQTQLATNATIPDLTTAAAVSNTLDMLGGSPGSVLLRGSTSWAALSIGTAGQVLRVGSGGVAWAAPKDSDLALTDITTNDVSTTKHGFAPMEPRLD